MKGRRLVVFCLLVPLFAGSAAAQLDSGNNIPRVRLRLAFSNGVCESSALVLLVGSGAPVAEAAPNDRCEAEFFNVPKGSYTLHVSGKNFANVDSGRIDLTSFGSEVFEVQVRLPNDYARNSIPSGRAFVSSSSLGIPSRARRELDKANELVDKQNWSQAIEKLNKAISIYPSYALAYNNLGTIYSRLGDVSREREALEKAIRLDDHLALAYVNLGRMNLAAGDFKEAQNNLDKAFAFDPTDPNALILLAYTELKQQRFDEAIATARKTHALDKPHAFAHRVAARAFEQQGQAASAIAELELFLKESPSGPAADTARQELETVKAALR